MKVFTWNERDNPDLAPAQVLADARKVARRFRGTSIGGGQEFGDASDHDAITTAFGRRWTQLFVHKQTPILFNRVWFKLLDCAWHKAHDGIEHISPIRGWSEALFKLRFRGGLKPFWFLDTHCMSKPATSELRGRLHAQHIELMRERIAALLAGDGYDVFVVGDFNVTTTPRLHPKQVVLHHHWLDHVIYIPGPNGNRLTVQDRITMTEALHTDHKPIGVQFALSPRKAA